MGNCLVVQEKVTPPPLLPTKNEKKKKAVHFSGDVLEDAGVVRIKVVIRKQEFEAMMKNGGLDDIVYNVQKEQKRNIKDESCMRWSPALESIPEL
ncbi:hypothetical protein BUALT_Bualt11G0098300 [Buddleja alternifolia]|uniref:Uncharacterized protein n=1 Tax=Buddleja alternifolia TaxID=168488 RepID=A0AAV6WVK3_9LAMI|nr:hypothetical protein BUALT_Bualt11G0098300 [Buddleja alternifolia]